MKKDDPYEKGRPIGRGGAVGDEIMFRQFRSLMALRHYELEDLVPMFRGALDDGCREILTRIMKPNAAFDQVVIPYRCLLRFYYQERAGYENVREHRKRGGPQAEIIEESRNLAL